MFGKKQQPGIAQQYAWCLTRAADVFASRFAEPSTTVAERILRFEAIALFGALVAWRYEKAGDIATRDAFFQHMFADFDAAMREKGVSDLKVGKEVKKLASAFYGRMSAYTPAFEAQSPAMLEAAMTRNHVLTASDDTAQVVAAVMADIGTAKAA